MNMNKSIGKALLVLLLLGGLVYVGFCVWSGSKEQCPGQMKRSSQRETAIYELLAKLPPLIADWRTLLTTVKQRKPVFCFGERDVSVVTEEGQLLLNNEVGPKELTARVAHLFLHIRFPIHFYPGEPCRQQVRKAMHKEAKAIALELKIRRHFQIENPHTPLAFAKQFWKIKQGRVVWLAKKLLQPSSESGSGVTLAREYMARCRVQLQER